ncbi:MAG: radical SAM protein [Candidatus Coatesbacteria bacterium]|nr:radical SAM protein [Candidatus Coatesbacteria bacterium]
MEIFAKAGREDIAIVYLAETAKGRLEFVESLQPPLTIEDKWVLIISTLYGCPVKCRICDAGLDYKGKLSFEEMSRQIEWMIFNRFKCNEAKTKKFKIQFSRMGEPSFNMEVLELIRKLPSSYPSGNLVISLSTIAPEGNDLFFRELLEIKKEYYSDNFQLQFSIHSTDEETRDWLIPVKKWNFEKISKYCENYYNGDKKITLNFALSNRFSIDARKLKSFFDPKIFLIKVTPLNPTIRVMQNGISSLDLLKGESIELIDELRENGYEVIVSIGEFEENKIGSNCGQFIASNMQGNKNSSYSYEVRKIKAE